MASDLIEITYAALIKAPEDWTFTQYEARNAKLDITIWIGNGLFPLRINGPGVSTRQEPRVFTGWLIPWRRQVLAAVREAASARLIARYQDVYGTASRGALAERGGRADG